MIAKELAIAGFSQVAGLLMAGQVETNITAAGASQATAYALSRTISNVTTTAASTGVILPQALQVGDSLKVRNGGANALLVYPPTPAGNINGLGAGVGYSVVAGKTATITSFDAGLTFGGEQSA